MSKKTLGQELVSAVREALAEQKKSRKNKMLKVAHEMAQGLYDVGAIDATTMHKFNINIHKTSH